MPEQPQACRFQLTGDWSINGVASQFPTLAQYLVDLATPQPEVALALPELDLAEITSLDACGCQLLAQFFLALQQCGLSPQLHNIPEACLAKMRLFGFDRVFNLSR